MPDLSYYTCDNYGTNISYGSEWSFAPDFFSLFNQFMGGQHLPDCHEKKQWQNRKMVKFYTGRLGSTSSGISILPKRTVDRHGYKIE